MKIRILSLLLLFLIIFTLMPVGVFATGVYSIPITKEPTPELKLTALSHRTVIFDSYPKDGLYYYSTNGGKDWLNVEWGEQIVLSKDITTISIKRIGSNTTEDSDIQVIHLSRHTPPTGISASTIKNGTITGVTSDMEYRNRTDLNYFSWLPITDTIVTNLAPGTYAVRVKASGTSFASDYVTVDIPEYVNKIPQQISYATAHLNKTYGDASFINELTQTIVSDEITYTSNNTNIVTVDRHTGEVTIVGPGYATITATVSETETHEQATASYDVKVSKANLTLKADDKTMTKGEVLPILTYTPTGLVNNDTFSTPPKVTTTADGKFIGTFSITITGGSVSNHQKYNITYTIGTLTVLDSHTITASANAGGSISPSSGVRVVKGENKTFTITPDSNYSIADVKVDGVSKGKITTYTFENVTANHTISVNFSYNGGGVSYTPPVVTEISNGSSTDASNLQRIISEGKTFTVAGENGAKLVFSTDALKGISTQATGYVKVEVKDVSSEYPERNRDEKVFSLTVLSGNSPISNFNGEVTVTLPYELRKGERAQDMTVWYLADDGTMTFIPSIYNVTTKLVTFKVDHFSLYVVDASSWENSFSDIDENDWFYSAVEFVNKTGLFVGTSKTTFSPNDSMTRVMFWTVMGRLDREVLVGNDIFNNVQKWAMNKGITDGMNPSHNITREQLLTILWRYEGSPKVEDSLIEFTDASSVTSYATDAFAWAVEKGILVGSNGALMPHDSATRTQIATILQRYFQSKIVH